MGPGPDESAGGQAFAEQRLGVIDSINIREEWDSDGASAREETPSASSFAQRPLQGARVLLLPD